MKQRTRLMALLLALILLLQCLPSTAFAAAPELLAAVGDALAAAGEAAPDLSAAVRHVLTPSETAQDLAWTLEDGVLTVTGTGDMPTWDSNGAPWYASRSEITEIRVSEGLTSIGPWAFHDCTNATSVTLPEGITSIASNAFYYCLSLSELVIPEGVTRIERRAFANCEALVDVTLPDTLTEIGNQAFVQCDALRSIVLPDSVTTLGAAVFDNCNALTEVTLPAGLTALPYQTFLNCTSLQTVVLPDGITAIHYEAFHNCHALGGLVLPDGVTTIGNSAFQNCSTLTALELPAGVTSLGNNAFDGCTALAALELPEGLTTIGSVAFKNCDSITEFVIPDSVTAIGSWAFESCDSLTAVKLSAGLTQISSNLFYLSAALTDVEIPDTVTSIGDLAFYGCDALTEIVVPDSVTSLGKNVFGNCDGLTDVTLSASLTTIPEEAFYDCDALAEIVIPEGITTIGREVFAYCNVLASVTLPSTLTEIGQGAFSNTKLSALELPEGLTTIRNDAFKNCDNLTELELPSTLTTIDSWVFHLMDGLTSIAIPDSVISMGDNVFNGCKNLTDVTLGAGLTAIPDETFRTCPSLATITIPENITSIGKYAFRESGLAQLDIPDSVTAIGQGAFYMCSALTDIVIPDSVTSLGSDLFYQSGLVSAKLGSGVTQLPYGTFIYCSNLEKVTLSDNITVFGGDDFRSCTALKEVNIPTALTIVGDGTFMECDSLVSVELPEGVVSIDDTAFYDCNILELVTLPQALTTIGNSAFYNCPKLDGIVLPDGLTTLGRSAFSGCKALTGIVIPDSVTSMDIEVFENCTSLAQVQWNDTLATIPSETFRGCTGLASFEIPDVVTTIRNSAFDGSGLKGIEIPATVTTLGDRAFAASALENVTLPATVTTLGEEVFNGCKKLKTAVVEEGITHLPVHTFSYCDALEEVSLPNGLTTLGTCAIERCSSLKEITLPSTLTSIGTLCFSNCDSLESIVIPDSVTTIMDQAFRDCDVLTTVELNEGLTELGSMAFYYCGSLSHMVLPNSLTQLQSSTFVRCTQMEWIWIPPTITSISSNAFREWGSKLVIRGIQGSHAETYANDKGIPFEYALTPGVRLTLSVTDPEGTAISGGYTVEWYQGDELVATGASFHADDLSLGYSYQVFLGEKLGMTYVQPERQQIPADCGGKLTLALEPIESRSLTGRVVDPQGNGIAAELTVTQSYSGGGRKELTAETDEQGFYSLTIDNVHTEAMIRAEGYFTNQQTLLAEPTDAQTVTAANAVLYPLPQGSRIELTVSASTAVREGEEPALVTHSGASLKYALFNETRNAAMDTPAFQNGTLYFNAAQASEGDVLVLTVTDPAGLYQAPQVRVTLEANGIGSADVLLVENGSIRIDAFTGVSAVRVMLFDSTDRLLEVRSVSGSYESPVLADGSYQLLLLEENGYIHSVSSPDELTALGLTEGTDYALLTADVHNGVITVLSGVAVPVLDTAGLCSTDPGKTWMQLSLSKAPVGQYVQVRLSYALNDDVDSADQTVQITLPDGVVLYDGGMYLGSESIAHSRSGNTVTVETGLSEAVLYFYVMPAQVGTHALNASLRYTGGGADRREPIGSAVLTVEETSIIAPERTKRETFPVTGKALPGSRVKIYDDQTLLAEATANAAGTWKAQVSPVNLLTFQLHDLYAVIEHSDLPAPITTAVSQVLYDIHYVELDRVLMHTSRGTFTFSYTDPKPVYSYMTERSYTFEVLFDGNTEQLRNVTLTIYCLSGKTVTVPVTYLEESGKWAVSVDLAHADAPINVGVGYECRFGEDYGEGLGLTELGKSEMEKLDTLIKDRAESMLVAGEVTETDTGVIVPIGIDGREETFADMVIEPLDFSIYENADLEELGFLPFHVPVSSTPAYMKVDYSADLLTFEYVEKEHQTAVRISTEVDFVGVEDLTVGDSAIDPQWNGWPEAWGEYGWNGSIRAIVDVFENTPIPGNIPVLISIGDQAWLERQRQRLDDEFNRRTGEFYKALEQTCPDGSLAIQGKNRQDLLNALNLAEDQHLSTIQQLNASMDSYQVRRFANAGLGSLFTGVGQGLKATKDALFKVLPAANAASQKWYAGIVYTELGVTCLDWFNSAITAFAADPNINNAFMDWYRNWFSINGSDMHAEMLKNYDMLYEQLDDLTPLLYSSPLDDIAGGNAGGGCQNPRPNNPPSPVPDVTPVIDPAGFVYEAVESNRLEGVTVTAYYQDEDGNAILWDAENYDQVNPLTTDSQGAYAWFVPMGMWQVKAELPGYETAYSEWLPVPPPQMEVNISLVSTAAPVVESAQAFEDGVMVTFSQYMDIESVQKAMKLSVGSGIAQPVDEEAAPDGVTMYARRFLLPIPEGTADAVRVTVSAEARNYAGTPIAQSWTSEAMKPIAAPTEVNMREEYSLVIGDSLTVNVTLLPGLADRKLLVETSTPLFLSPSVSEIVTDEQGNASFTLSAMLPGVGYITVREPDSGLSATAKVHIRLTEAEEVAPVVVTLDDGTEAAESQAVPAGTKLTLTTATEGAQIRYTLDGSCPCRSGAIVYTEPLAITGDTRLMVAAVVDGVFGPISEYRFTIAKPENPFTDVPEGSFYYEPVLWAVKNGITNGTTPTTFGPSDQCMRAHVVTFLWRAVGSPDPGSDTNPFVDVKETDFYYKAVLWAVEQGITNGLDATHFGPFAYCNRAQVVTFLHRSLGSPAPTTTVNPFTDVPAGQWYTAPVLWAVENGITNGLSSTVFGPTSICNRAQIVTFLYRAIA